jgi:hypothetical protein
MLKVKWKFGKLVVSILCIICVYLCLFVVSVKAGDFPNFSNGNGGDWSDGYYRPISITNSTGSLQTDYQVKVTLTTAALGNPYTHIKVDGSDIRFTTTPPPNSGTELSYWIESWVVTGTSTVWVKIPSLPANDSYIYMWYGNISATAVSSGANTFDTFYDLRGLSSLPPGWTSAGTVNYYSNGISVNTWGYALTTASYGNVSDRILDEYVVMPASSGGTSHYVMGFADTGKYATDGYSVGFDLYQGQGGSGGWFETCNRASYTNIIAAGITYGTSEISSIRYNGGTAYFYSNYTPTPLVSTTSTVPTSALSIGINNNQQDGTANTPAIMSWIRVRKYASPEPLVSSPQTELRPKNYVLISNSTDLNKGNTLKAGENIPQIKLELTFVPLVKDNQASARFKRLRIDKYIPPDTTAIPDDKIEVSVWAEANNNNQWDEKDTLISKGTFKDGTIWLDMNKLEITTEPQTFYIACKTSEGISNKQTSGIEIRDTSCIEFEEESVRVRVNKTSFAEETEIKDIPPPANQDKALETALQHELSGGGYKSWSPYYDLISKSVEQDTDNLLWKVILSYHSPIARSISGPFKGNLIPPKATDLIRIIKLTHPLKPEIENLIKLLGDDDWETREDATKKLISIGRPAVSLVKEALNSSDPEVRMRAEYILKNEQPLTERGHVEHGF